MSNFSAQQYNQMYQQNMQNNYNNNNNNQGRMNSVIPMKAPQQQQQQAPQNNFQQMNNMIGQKNQQQQQQPSYPQFSQQGQQQQQTTQYQQQQQALQQYQQQFQQPQQQQQFNQNVFQMQKLHMQLQQQQQQPNQQQDFYSQNNPIQQQLMLIKGQFPYQIDSSNQNPKQQIALCKLQTNNNLEIPIKIILDEKFPSVKPQVFVQRKFIHKFIDNSNWEIAYMGFYNWNQNQKLIDLLRSIQAKFIEMPPTQDAMLRQITEIQDSVNEDKVLGDFMNTPLSQIFPEQAANQKWDDIAQNQNYTSNIKNIESYKKLQNHAQDLAQNLENYSDTVGKQAQEIELKKSLLQNQVIEYENMQQKHLQKHQHVQLIQDRFSSNAVMQLLDQEIEKLDESTANLETLENVDTNNFDQFLKDYTKQKSLLFTYTMKRAKFIQ